MLPGYYFDPARGRYFRTGRPGTAAHAAAQAAAGTPAPPPVRLS